MPQKAVRRKKPRQMPLPFMVADCQDGKHPDLIDLPPVQEGDCINVDRVCPVCGTVVYTVSTRIDL